MAKIDLTPQTLDLVLYAGDGVRFRLVITDKNEDPVDITGEVRAQVRDKRGETDLPEGEFAVDLTSAADGIAVLSLTGDQTQALFDNAVILAPKTKKFVGVWDVEWTPLDSEPRTLCQGKVECGPDVTR